MVVAGQPRVSTWSWSWANTCSGELPESLGVKPVPKNLYALYIQPPRFSFHGIGYCPRDSLSPPQIFIYCMVFKVFLQKNIFIMVFVFVALLLRCFFIMFICFRLFFGSFQHYFLLFHFLSAWRLHTEEKDKGENKKKFYFLYGTIGRKVVPLISYNFNVTINNEVR